MQITTTHLATLGTKHSTMAYLTYTALLLVTLVTSCKKKNRFSLLTPAFGIQKQSYTVAACCPKCHQ